MSEWIKVELSKGGLDQVKDTCAFEEWEQVVKAKTVGLPKDV